MKLGLVGHPIAHSRSPLLHAAALRAAGLSGSYVLLDHADPSTVAQRFDALRDGGFAGFNVTVPYKLDALRWIEAQTAPGAGAAGLARSGEFMRAPGAASTAGAAALSRSDELARVIGAVNTVRFGPDGRAEGHNTDAEAAVASAEARLGRCATVLCAGTGGAARAVLAGFGATGAVVDVVGRDAAKVAALRAEFGLRERVEAPELVINATSVGHGATGDPGAFDALIGDRIRGARLAFDLVYGAEATAFVRWARGYGVATMDGLDMLVRQAAHAFELWTGVPRHQSHAAMAAAVGLAPV